MVLKQHELCACVALGLVSRLHVNVMVKWFQNVGMPLKITKIITIVFRDSAHCQFMELTPINRFNAQTNEINTSKLIR